MMRLISVFTLAILGSAALFAEQYEEVPESAESVPVPPFIDLNKADFEGAPQEHTVVEGDTLWDLSAEFLKSPWYWPKLWSLNPQIKNPHLIYVGDRVSFKPTGEIILAPTEGLVESDDTEEGEEDEYARSGKTLDRRPEDFKDYVTLGGRYRIEKFKNIDDTVFDVPKQGFVSDRELKSVGKVVAAFEKKEMLATEDSCYVKMKQSANIGDYVQFFRTEGDITHPVTGDPAGKKIVLLGRGKVLDMTNDGIATVRIVKSYDAIERGTLVRAWQETPKHVKIAESKPNVKGYVMDSLYPIQFSGDGHLIFLDLGKKDGLETGMMLKVYRKACSEDNDLSEEDVAALPYEAVGEVVVVTPYEKSSTAVVVKSLISIERGDFVTAGGVD